MIKDKSGREQPGSQGWGRVAQYAALSLGSFLCALILLALLLLKPEKLIALGLTGYLYFLVLVPFGLLAAAFLFGALRSSASYRGKQFGGILQLGGPVVLFLIVLILGFWLPPPSSNFPLTVYVHGLGGNQDLILRGNGYVRIDTGGLPRKAAIGNDGEAFFPEVPANFRGQEVNVSLDAAGYELAETNQKVRLNSSSVYLQVRRKAGRFAGRVHNDQGMPIEGVRITVAGVTAATDAAGYFQFIVPGENLQADLTLEAVADGYVATTEPVIPNSNEITITLRRH